MIEPASGKLLGALTTLGPGSRGCSSRSSWTSQGGSGRRASAKGVRRGSEFHLTEYFGPVLGLMRAETLDEALEIQNQVPYGLTAGLHSLDPDEGQAVAGRRGGGQPLRQPGDHGSDRPTPTVRGMEAVERRSRREGWRSELPDRPR